MKAIFVGRKKPYVKDGVTRTRAYFDFQRDGYSNIYECSTTSDVDVVLQIVGLGTVLDLDAMPRTAGQRFYGYDVLGINS